MKFVRLMIFILILLFPSHSFAEIVLLSNNEVTNNKEISFDSEWNSMCDSLKNVESYENINIWKVEDYELATMYNDEFVFRRENNLTEAYIIFNLPYIEKLIFVSYFWPKNEGMFKLYKSIDNKNWTEHQPEIEKIVGKDDGSLWAKHTYTYADLSPASYIKIVWPELDPSVNDWWNPYFGSMSAIIGCALPQNIVFNMPSKLEIPIYDSNNYLLSGFVSDQIGNPMDYDIMWEITGDTPQGIILKNNRELIIDPSCKNGTNITLKASASVTSNDDVTQQETLSAEYKISLVSAVIGDINKDGIIDLIEINCIKENYGTTQSHSDWNNLRLLDIDKNQILDVIDMAYLSYQYACTNTDPDVNNSSEVE